MIHKYMYMHQFSIQAHGSDRIYLCKTKPLTCMLQDKFLVVIKKTKMLTLWMTQAFNFF